MLLHYFLASYIPTFSCCFGGLGLPSVHCPTSFIILNLAVHSILGVGQHVSRPSLIIVNVDVLTFMP